MPIMRSVVGGIGVPKQKEIEKRRNLPKYKTNDGGEHFNGMLRFWEIEITR